MLMCLSVFTVVKAKRIDMKKAGADMTAKGAAKNTKLIKNQFAKLSKQGGDTLYFPSGTYLTGPIEMKSNITIELEAGAVLKFPTTLTCIFLLSKCVTKGS